jgi:hypothetical protein
MVASNKGKIVGTALLSAVDIHSACCKTVRVTPHLYNTNFQYTDIVLKFKILEIYTPSIALFSNKLY